MSLNKEQIEHLEKYMKGAKSHSRKWKKKQLHKWMRLQAKKNTEPVKKKYKGWEW